MILRPDTARGAASPQPIPVWNAILPTQRERAERCLLIAQDDHARLAGEFASVLKASWLPELTDEIVEAIGMHDCGWRDLDEELLARARAGERPVSFLDMTVPEFLTAWTGSIDRTAERTPTGGAVVSVHFSRLAEYRLAQRQDTPEGTRLLARFVEAEAERRAKLVPPCGASPLPFFTDALQLCDLVSLYLCCGSEASVEFPQFNGKLKILRQGERFACEGPADWKVGAQLEVPANWAGSDGGPLRLRFDLGNG